MSVPVELEVVHESEKPEKTTILWVSRHSPLPAQIAELEKKLGGIVIYQLSGVIPNAEFVVEVAKKVGAKIIVPVLPLSMVARLAELSKSGGFTVVMAKMEALATTEDGNEVWRLLAEKPGWRVPVTYAGGATKVYEFKSFEKLVRVELVTEPL